MNAKIYLNVPYKEKDAAKSMGANWDAQIKKWFFDGAIKDISRFGKWIADGHEQTLIVYECFHIIEALRPCFKCGKKTRIIGLGIGEHSILMDNDDDTYSIDDPEDFPEMNNEIYLAWSASEEDIPPLLLSYIKSTYNVKTGYSSVAGKCFANHCDHCGVIQGNNYLFYEDSPLNTMTPVEGELIKRMSELKIYNVYTDVALPLRWEHGYCSNDWAYLAYCKNIEDLTLLGAEDMWTSYSEMFCI
jgi:hypothetical protein